MHRRLSVVAIFRAGRAMPTDDVPLLDHARWPCCKEHPRMPALHEPDRPPTAHPSDMVAGSSINAPPARLASGRRGQERRLQGAASYSLLKPADARPSP